MSVHVTSEIGVLQSVLVHTPGRELEAVTPGNRADYLYDDIIDLEIAQREHRQFVSVLKRFARVLQVRDLLGEILQQPEARDYLITKTMDVVPSDALAQRLTGLPAEEIVDMLIEGTEEESGPISRALNEVGFAFPPLPNLFFPRDIGMVIGDHVVVGAMRHGVRWTEELLINALFRFHPELANAGMLYDGSEERRSNYTLEGGDVHYLRPDLLVVGFSERTSPAALDQLCETVFEPRTGHRRAGGGHAQGTDRHPSGHDLLSGRPRAVRGLSPLFRWARAAASAPPPKGNRWRA